MMLKSYWLSPIVYDSLFLHHFETPFKLKSRSLYGRTSLHFAAYHGRSEIIHQLLGAGLDSSIQDAFGKTAVHYARENEHFEAARWCWLGRWQYGSQGGIQKAKDENGNPGPKLLQSLHSKKKPSTSANTARSKSSEKVQKWLRRVSKWFSQVTAILSSSIWKPKSDQVTLRTQLNRTMPRDRIETQEKKWTIHPKRLV